MLGLPWFKSLTDRGRANVTSVSFLAPLTRKEEVQAHTLIRTMSRLQAYFDGNCVLSESARRCGRFDEAKDARDGLD
jgi:hypothetical protein